MTLQFAIRIVGLSHLLQPPLTLALAKRLGLARAFDALPPLPAAVARNMGFASVFLPTLAGTITAISADEIVRGGGVRYLAWLLCAFWTWRLWRQTILGPLLPRAWHVGLCAIFIVQGPIFALVLLRALP